MKSKWAIVLTIVLLLVVTSVAMAAEGFTISLNRDFGYGGFGNQIQGTFSLKVQGDEVFEKVIFMMDEVVLGEDSEAPYRIQFSTDNYEPGEHQYWARGIQADGSELESNRIVGMVLTKAETRSNMIRIFVVLGVAIGGVAIVSTFVTNRVSKNVNQNHSFETKGIPDGFSTRGGSICPKCGKPFSFHFWRMNLMTHKLDRCPHCGKWVLVKSMSYRMLEEKIRSVRQNDLVSDHEKSVEERQADEINKKLDDSKFMD